MENLLRGLGFRDSEAFGFRLWDSEFRAQGLGFEAPVPSSCHNFSSLAVTLPQHAPVCAAIPSAGLRNPNLGRQGH